MNLPLATTLVLILTCVAASTHLREEGSQAANGTEFKAAVAKKDWESPMSLIPATATKGENLIADSIWQSSASTLAALSEALRTSFGSAVEAEAVFKPFYLTGDFNGDGGQDIVIAVRIKGRRSTLPKDVTVLNPFESVYGKATFPTDPIAKPTLALAIIHGTNAGWQTPQPSAKFLLFGESPILILNFARTTSGPEALESLMSLIKLGRQRRGDSLPLSVKKARKGDVIVLGTEATDSFLYWNGKTYRWEEDPSGD